MTSERSRRIRRLAPAALTAGLALALAPALTTPAQATTPELATALAARAGTLSQAVMSHAAATSPAVNQVGLTGNPQAVAVDPATDTAYVAELAKSPPGNVAVIDLATDTVTTTITVGSRPSAVAVNPVTGLVYVTNAASDSVSVIDGAANTVIQTITGLTEISDAVNGVAVDSATDTVYVGLEAETSAGAAGAVAVINGATSTVTGTISATCCRPIGIAADPATGTVYAAFNGPSPAVSVINEAENAATGTISLAGQPQAIDVDTATDVVYVAEYGESLYAYSGATGALTATIGLGGVPYGVAVNPGTDTIYATAYNNAYDLATINGATSTISGTIPLAYPRAVAVDQATGTVIVTDLTYVSVITGDTA